LVSEFLTAFLGWNPEPHLLELVAWAVYIVSVGYALLRLQSPGGRVARPAEAHDG
jgi:high-affinity Fe2+/Pb2+ permease